MLFCDEYSLQIAPQYSQDEALFTGMLGTRALSSGMNLSLAQITSIQDSQHAVIFPRSLCIVHLLEGRPSEIDPGGNGEKLLLKPGETVVYSFASPSFISGHYQSGEHSKSILIQLRPEHMYDANLSEFVETYTKQRNIMKLGVNPHLHRLCRWLLHSNISGSIEGLLVESYALELVARTLQEISEDSSKVFKKGPDADRSKMKMVKDLLIAEPEKNHSLNSLALEVGVSVSSLKNKFREIHGQPVFTFLHEVRMEQAKKSIESEHWTITQAAYFSGYRHTSNFSKAYQQYFGHSPGRRNITDK